MRRRHNVIVQKPVETQGSGGDIALTWTEFDQVRAKRTTLGASETLETSGLMTATREELDIYRRPGITPKMRILARAEDTTLNGAIVATDLVLIVASADGFPLDSGSGSVVPYSILVESELMSVTAGHGTTSWAVTRGVDGTTAASHANAVVIHRMEVLDIEAVVDPTGRRDGMKLTAVVHG